VPVKASDSIPDKLDLFSITIDLMDLLSKALFEEIIWIREGSHSLEFWE
jgi:hypothetical protein